MFNVPVNNFSVMLGRSHRFLSITSTFFFFFFFWGGGGKYYDSLIPLFSTVNQFADISCIFDDFALFALKQVMLGITKVKRFRLSFSREIRVTKRAKTLRHT